MRKGIVINPEFINDVFDTVESATTRLDRLLTQLRNKQIIENEQVYDRYS